MHLRTLEYLTSPELAPLYWPGVVTGLVIAVLCASLSVVVVLKRMAFIGQGISHAAFGGVGVAAVLGLAAAGGAGAGLGQSLVVLAFCLAAGLGIGWLSEKGQTQSDTAIGIVLVASMALGAVLLQYAHLRGRAGSVAWESLLFGSIMNVAWPDSIAAIVVALAIIAGLWLARRPMLFWAFDEPAAPAFGVPTRAMRFILLLMLAVATVTAMKLAGVVLATAMLVLPGATALQLSHRFGRVMIWSQVIAIGGVLAGLILSFEFDQPTGACIVLVLSLIFGAAWVRRAWLSRAGRAGPAGAGGASGGAAAEAPGA
ncbi:MAG: metal ABC transporter permease [Phycisphaerales bacterium]|nr:metal ABC transporter permease [Phycisphaerales bacterium]